MNATPELKRAMNGNKRCALEVELQQLHCDHENRAEVPPHSWMG